ncbi:MAG TPA: AI-2E family transporter [Candidatus Limnocylindrales bacterium]|nr:AI-2E family transporter [Candidatus Limnocylindrales bacterium]
MSEPSSGRGLLDARERRWLDALLVLGTAAVAVILVGLISNILLFFSDILLIFFLAWLLAFVLEPIVTAIQHLAPFLRRGMAVIVTYAILLVLLTLIVLVVAQALAASLQGFVDNLPQLQAQLPQMLAPWQDRLAGLGLQVDLQAAARQGLDYIGSLGTNLAQPLTGLAVASLGIFGNLLIILFLSLYVVIDRDRISSFIARLVPPRYTEEYRLLSSSVSRSFGGFLRGQAVMGVMYGILAFALSAVLGLDYGPLSAASAGLLQAIPFFGPFVSWAPPVIVAVLTKPAVLLPVVIVMAAGWLVIMNLVQPRLMAEAVGIHPVVVLASVIVGAKIAGIAGAIFSVPVAAVISSFFFYSLTRSAAGPRDVTSRAARLVESREGRQVRVPKPPEAATIHDPAGEDVTGPAVQQKGVPR